MTIISTQHKHECSCDDHEYDNHDTSNDAPEDSIEFSTLKRRYRLGVGVNVQWNVE